MSKKIKVLIVDDSATVRQTLTEILHSDPKIKVIGTASDPYFAAAKIKKILPDVITLDVEMPRMDGITFLQKLMSQHPIPVVMVSSLTQNGSETSIKALEYGATEIITKPTIGIKNFIKEAQIRICDAVKAAALVKPKRITQQRVISPKLSADAVLAKPKSKAMIQTTNKIIVVGASTGGTEALRIFLESMPLDAPPIVVVQHMPGHFTRTFAERLNGLCHISVKEAQNNDTVIRSQALIAPGNKHMLLKRSGARYFVEVKEGPLVNRHRPAVDVLFRSAARYGGKNVVGVIMTGMGDDGAKGMVEMHEAGAFTIAQDEHSCVVFGMPAEAIKAGGVRKVLPLQNIASYALKMAGY